MSDVKKAVVSDAIRTLADALGAEIKIDAKTGLATITEGAYEKNLPEGVTIEHAQKLQTYNTQLLAAGGLALGEKSNSVFKKSKELAETDLVLPLVGKDNFEYNYKRSTTTKAPKTEANPDPKEIVKFGVLTASHNIYGAGKDRGELGNVRRFLNEAAAKSLG